jgi:hypothetical protein
LRERGAAFILVEDIHPPPRIELARAGCCVASILA